MELQKSIQSSRLELVADIIQLVSGVSLALFLWTHMIFVGSILLGVSAFNKLAAFMEEYFFLQAAVAFIIVAFIAHVGAVLRRIPGRWADQKIIWKHAKTIRHGDTWSWLFQLVSGGLILILATIHVFVVVYGGINADLSSARMNSPFLWFYIALLFLGEYHASIGLYRAAIKWGWIKRQTAKRVLGVATLIFIAIGLFTIWTLYLLGRVV
jgi:fumarate reductase subunit C